MTAPLRQRRFKFRARLWLAREWPNLARSAPMSFWTITPQGEGMPDHSEYRAAMKAFERDLKANASA